MEEATPEPGTGGKRYKVTIAVPPVVVRSGRKPRKPKARHRAAKLLLGLAVGVAVLVALYLIVSKL